MRGTSALLLACLAAAAHADETAPGPAPEPSTAAPRIAIVIDDFGLTYPANPADEKWLALAREAGIDAVARDAFLDEPGRHEEAYCRLWLGLTARRARRRGYALAIGHHYFEGTYECLRRGVPELEAQGYRFVPASELARSAAARRTPR